MRQAAREVRELIADNHFSLLAAIPALKRASFCREFREWRATHERGVCSAIRARNRRDVCWRDISEWLTRLRHNALPFAGGSTKLSVTDAWASATVGDGGSVTVMPAVSGQNRSHSNQATT